MLLLSDDILMLMSAVATGQMPVVETKRLPPLAVPSSPLRLALPRPPGMLGRMGIGASVVS